MNKLILPDSEPTNAQLILSPQSRRGFMKTLTAAFTGLVAAPVIVPAANLMQIHSPTNRLIVAFERWRVFGTETEGDMFPSFLNLTDYTEASFRAWEALHYTNCYSLVRRGAIPPHNESAIGGRHWSGIGNTPLEQQLHIKLQHNAARNNVLNDIDRYINDPEFRVRYDKMAEHFTKRRLNHAADRT